MLIAGYACCTRYARGMAETISQREMRNRSGEVLRAVAAGKSFIITNDGVEVAELVQRSAPRAKPAPERPALEHKGFSELKLYDIDGTVQESLDDLRREWWEDR